MTIPDFDAATALTRVSPQAGDSATDATTIEWAGYMTSEWSIGPVPNGGYTQAILARALLDHTGCSSASSLTTHYYRPTIGDAPCVVRTDLQRIGRSTTHADAVLEQDGKIRARAVGVFGSYPDEALFLASSPPSITSADDCPVRDPQSQGLNMTLLNTLEVRLDVAIDAPVDPHASEARIDGWVRFRDGRANDALALCLFVDAFPPAVLTAVADTGWVPTIELTTHIRAQAAPGWIRGEVTTSNVRGGTLIEDIRLWDSTDSLVAEARQLALHRTN